jgi:membrane-associated phospholipid phosphatase
VTTDNVLEGAIPSAAATPDPDRWRRLPERASAGRFALAGALTFAIGLVLAYFVATMETTMNAHDLPVNEWFRNLGQSSSLLTSGAKAISWIGAGAQTVPIVLFVAVVLVLFKQWRWSLFLLVSSQAGFLLSHTMKDLVARDRPPWGFFDPTQTGTSFPSGHTFAGVTGWIAMGIIALYLFPRPWSTILGVVLIVIGVLNGPSRLILARHWITDVLGALLLAGGWFLLVWSAFLWFWAPRRKSDAKPEPESIST